MCWKPMAQGPSGGYCRVIYPRSSQTAGPLLAVLDTWGNLGSRARWRPSWHAAGQHGRAAGRACILGQLDRHAHQGGQPSRLAALMHATYTCKH